MKKYLLITVLLLKHIVCSAQELNVFKCEVVPTDITARTSPRKDLNDELCAILKVSSPAEIVKVLGNTIGEIEKRGTQYWIYFSAGTKQLQLLFNEYKNVNVVFSDYGINKVETAVVIDVQLDDIITSDEEVTLFTASKYYAAKRFKPAIKLLIPLAERGNVKAQLLLIAYYLEELKDYDRAFTWLDICSENSIDAKLIYGTLLVKMERDVDKGLNMITEVADMDHNTQAIELLINLYNGNLLNGKYKDPQKAYQYGLILASKGDKNVQYYVACCLYAGNGVEKNEKEAVHWFTCAAQQGHRDSQRLLGAILTMGCPGQAKDIDAAKRWLNMAASQGDEEAIKLLNDLQ